mmetsp:Transcript_31958/g.73512  ORF Transcript_31958/g.73512 Transcript_31958/m.73512 type:complete len:89 (+) Transcript_31958:885-1151(+)
MTPLTYADLMYQNMILLEQFERLALHSMCQKIYLLNVVLDIQQKNYSMSNHEVEEEAHHYTAKNSLGQYTLKNLVNAEIVIQRKLVQN